MILFIHFLAALGTELTDSNFIRMKETLFMYISFIHRLSYKAISTKYFHHCHAEVDSFFTENLNKLISLQFVCIYYYLSNNKYFCRSFN